MNYAYQRIELIERTIRKALTFYLHWPLN